MCRVNDSWLQLLYPDSMALRWASSHTVLPARMLSLSLSENSDKEVSCHFSVAVIQVK
jgi:hypothetical protein